MRVWLINHHALPPSEPGGTRHYTLARELIRNGHDVTVIASSFNHATGKQMSCARGKLRTFEQLGEVPFLFLSVPAYRSQLARFWNMFVFAFELWLGLGTRTMRKPDIVIGSSLTLFAAFAAERLARRLRVPFVLEIRDLWPQTLIDMGMRPHHPAVVCVWNDRAISVSQCGQNRHPPAECVGIHGPQGSAVKGHYLDPEWCRPGNDAVSTRPDAA